MTFPRESHSGIQWLLGITVGGSGSEVCETGTPEGFRLEGISGSHLIQPPAPCRVTSEPEQLMLSLCTRTGDGSDFVFNYGTLSPSDKHKFIIWVTVGIWLIFQMWLIIPLIKNQCSLCCSVQRWIPAFGGKRKWWLSLVLIYQFLPRPHVPCTAWFIKSLYQGHNCGSPCRSLQVMFKKNKKKVLSPCAMVAVQLQPQDCSRHEQLFVSSCQRLPGGVSCALGLCMAL